MKHPWDYLIVTASNDLQAGAYQRQLDLRRRLGLLADFGTAWVVPDPGGRRIGSGGSTLYCLVEVLRREFAGTRLAAGDWSAIERLLGRLRILILHAGGDSRRLPAYGPCGKIFVPIPAARRGQSHFCGLLPQKSGQSPVPGPRAAAIGRTVFDDLLATFGSLPGPVAQASPIVPEQAGRGQVVVAAGDALIRFDASCVKLAAEGVTALGCAATPQEASRHGVFCAQQSGPVRRFLQKPAPAEQAAAGAIDAEGMAILDLAVMSFDAPTAVKLLRAFDVGIVAFRSAKAAPEPRDFRGAKGDNATAVSDEPAIDFSEPMRRRIETCGLDLYREICCALGTEATTQHHRQSAQASGSRWDDQSLAGLHARLNPIPFHVEIVPQCSFLHFGTTRQLITSGLELVRLRTGEKTSVAFRSAKAAPEPRDFRGAKGDNATVIDSPVLSNKGDAKSGAKGTVPFSSNENWDSPQNENRDSPHTILDINNRRGPAGEIRGEASWVEGCRLDGLLKLAYHNVVIGVDVDARDAPLSLPPGACLDVLAGRDRQGHPVYFVRCYHVADTFKDSVGDGATFGGRPLLDRLDALGARPEDIWDPTIPAAKRSLWDARVFPAVQSASDYRYWLWQFEGRAPTEAQRRAFLDADRYSVAEIAWLADQEAFHARRSHVTG